MKFSKPICLGIQKYVSGSIIPNASPHDHRQCFFLNPQIKIKQKKEIGLSECPKSILESQTNQMRDFSDGTFVAKSCSTQTIFLINI